MIYACPIWEFAADTRLMKLQHLQNKVLTQAGRNIIKLVLNLA
jgi:hypothetical protein